MAERSRKAKA